MSGDPLMNNSKMPLESFTIFQKETSKISVSSLSSQRNMKTTSASPIEKKKINSIVSECHNFTKCI